uniref:MD-2-related lipid-recognition domain-containing protein n=1 Tax=Erpetoichthys calabaricus TaxID=27687 RepID=A0A8C4T4V8_ERPCA
MAHSSIVQTNLYKPSCPWAMKEIRVSLDKGKFCCKIQVEVKKNVWGFWIEVPCVDHIGSCTYNNVCEWLNHNFSKKCPFGLTSCQCPVKQGEINIPETTFELPQLKLPDFLSDGTYKITIKSTSGDQHIACFTTTVTLQTESSSSGWLLGKQ